MSQEAEWQTATDEIESSASNRAREAARGSDRREGTAAVGYLHVCTDEQAREGLSLDAQQLRIRSYCDAKQWELLRVYRDEGGNGALA